MQLTKAFYFVNFITLFTEREKENIILLRNFIQLLNLVPVRMAND